MGGTCERSTTAPFWDSEEEWTLQVQLDMNRVGSSSFVTPRRLGVALVVLCVLALVKTFNLGDMHGGGGSRGDAVVPAAQEWAREVGDRLDAQVWSISHLCDPCLLACSLAARCMTAYTVEPFYYFLCICICPLWAGKLQAPSTLQLHFVANFIAVVV